VTAKATVNVSPLGWRLFTRYLGGGGRHLPGHAVNTLIATGSVVATLYVLWIGALAVLTGDAALGLFQHLEALGHPLAPLEHFANWARSYTANFHSDISVFIAVTFPIAFLTTSSHIGRRHLNVWDVLLALTSFGVAVYYLVEHDKFLNWSYGFSIPSTWDMVVGLTLVGLVIELCRRSTGWGLTSLVLVLILFCVFGEHMPGALKHENFSWAYFVEMLTITDNGIYGSPLEVAATYAFLFVLFGNFYEKTGGGELFYGVSTALTGRMRGGAVKACIASSGLYGSVSGSPTADVATTGPLTIPLMKRQGVTPARAAAIEATASSGGAMLPPVMGAVAFIMSDMTGLSYASIALASLLPAVVYYLAIFITVHNEAVRNGEGRLQEDQIPKLGATLLKGWRHLLPLMALVGFLMMGFTPVYVAAGATASIIVLSWFSVESAIGPRRFVECCTQTIFQIVPLIGAVAAAGIIIGGVEIGALAGKFTLLITYLSGGYLVSTLLMSAVFLILLGMGMPTPAVYLTASALLAPVLSQSFKLPLMQLHLFMVYFACLSAITPPVAVANFAASAIADADPMAVGTQAVKLALGGFMLPFFFLFNPALNFEGSALAIGQAFVIATAMVGLASVAANGHLGKQAIPGTLRLMLMACAVTCITPVGWVQWLSICTGMMLLLVTAKLKPRPV
jgi:TRAP transporter 4TM/12TM fusion protein